MRRGKFITLICIFFLSGFCKLALSGDVYSKTAKIAGGTRENLKIKTKFSQHSFLVEIARTLKEQSFGLMFRKKLSPNSGMLFTYPRVQYVKMWMKNTFIPLDILFISRKGRIVKIVERAIPGSRQIISSDHPIQAVLEVKGGTVSQLKISLGDLVKHSFFNNLK